jgi:hypothetical protein
MNILTCWKKNQTKLPTLIKKGLVSLIACVGIIFAITIMAWLITRSLDKAFLPAKAFYQNCDQTITDCDYLIMVQGVPQCVIIKAYEPLK